MNNSKNLRPTLLQAIDDPIALDKQFPHLRVRRFGHASPTLRKRFEPFSRSNETLDDGIGILCGIPGDVILNIFGFFRVFRG